MRLLGRTGTRTSGARHPNKIGTRTSGAPARRGVHRLNRSGAPAQHGARRLNRSGAPARHGALSPKQEWSPSPSESTPQLLRTIPRIKAYTDLMCLECFDCVELQHVRRWTSVSFTCLFTKCAEWINGREKGAFMWTHGLLPLCFHCCAVVS